MTLASLIEQALAPLQPSPPAEEMTEIDEGRFQLLVTPRKGPCFWCGEWTSVIDISFEAHLCLRCHDHAWAEYFRAERMVSDTQPHLRDASLDRSDLSV